MEIESTLLNFSNLGQRKTINLLFILQTRMYHCWLSMTHLKTGQRNILMKNGFQIRIQLPRISFGFTKIEAHMRDRSKAKTACATCHPPVVLKSPNLRQSYFIIRLYHHTIGKVHTISPLCSIRGGYFFKKVPLPIPTVCMENVYRRRVNQMTLEGNTTELRFQIAR